jgi:hypothetical protein
MIPMRPAHRYAIFFNTFALALVASVGVHAQSPEAINTKWLTYTDLGGFYKVNFPSSWQVLTKGNAVVITSPGGMDDRGVFGITPRAEGVTVESSIEKEFSDPDHAPDLTKYPARIANLSATKVVGSKKGNPNIRIVEYYVQRGTQQYYILFQGPRLDWATYSPVFEKMIASLHFIK